METIKLHWCLARIKVQHLEIKKYNNPKIVALN